MKRLIPLFLILLLTSTGFALAETYGPAPQPGTKLYYPSSYVQPAQPNNIGIEATACMNLTVKIKNTAPWSQFIIMNPYYHYVVLNREDQYKFGSTGEFPGWITLPYFERKVQAFLWDFDVYGALPGDRVANDINLLRYRLVPRVGAYDLYPVVWLNPYETITLKISACYPVKLMNFNVPFPYVLNYTEKPDQLSWQYYTTANATYPTPITYGPLVPQLVNAPQYVINPVQMFEQAPNLKVLSYNATVSINIKKTYATDIKEFRLVFAVAPPILFPNARYTNCTIDGFIPATPSATFQEFIHTILPAYTDYHILENQNAPAQSPHHSVQSHLLTGIKGLLAVNTQQVQPSVPSHKGTYNPYLDFPVWLVWLEKGGISIQYSVHWDPSTKPGMPKSWYWQGGN